MTADGLGRLFSEAIARPPAERVAFLERACAGDHELFRRLEDMIETHGRAERLAFLNSKGPPPAIPANGIEGATVPSPPPGTDPPK